MLDPFQDEGSSLSSRDALLSKSGDDADNALQLQLLSIPFLNLRTLLSSSFLFSADIMNTTSHMLKVQRGLFSFVR